MTEELPEAERLYRDALEGVGEGQFADAESIPLADARRVAQKLTLSVATTPRDFKLSLSLRQIQELSDGNLQEIRRTG